MRKSTIRDIFELQARGDLAAIATIASAAGVCTLELRQLAMKNPQVDSWGVGAEGPRQASFFTGTAAIPAVDIQRRRAACS